MYYGKFYQDGSIEAFYHSSVNEIPFDALSLTDEQHTELLGYQTTKRFIDGTVVTIKPLPPAPPAPRTSLYKTEIYSRMTDQELDRFDREIESAPTRIRLMWRDCLEVQADSNLFPLLQAQMTEEFGKDRTAEILSLELERR